MVLPMAALPPVLSSLALMLEEVERKVCVCVGGETGTGARGGKGTEENPGDFSALSAVQSMLCSVMCVWELRYSVVYFWHMCECVFSLQLENKRSLILRGSWE